MLKRTITAVVMTLVLLPFLIFSGKVEFLIPILVTILSSIACYEFLGCIQKKTDYVVCIPAYLLATLLPFTTYFFSTISNYLLLATACFVVYLLYLFAVAVFRMGEMKFEEVAVIFIGVFYITLSFAMFALLRHKTYEGAYLYLLVFFGAWVTDTFAYLTGRVMGKHKLNPVISPKKTIEGSIGGILFCMLSFVGFGLVMQFAFEKTVNYIMLLIAGVICSVVSQIGDLIMSLIKREHGIKDYGFIFPGHGGVLDRFDSILAITPVLFILCNLQTIWPWAGILS